MFMYICVLAYMIMKRLILVLSLIIASVTAAKAQYAYPSEISSVGSKIYAYGDKLTTQQAYELFSEVGGEQMGEEYLKNRKGFRTGLGLTIAGPPVAVVGYFSWFIGALMSLDSDLSPVSEIVFYTGATMLFSGTAMTVAGIPTTCIYRHRIKKATEEYNASVNSKPVVTFSPARSGIGIAMNF